MSSDSVEKLAQKIKATKEKLNSKNGSLPWISPTRPTKIITDIISGVAVGAFLGYLVDAWLNTIPLFIFILIVFGGICGVYLAQRDIRRNDVMNSNKEKTDA